MCVTRFIICVVAFLRVLKSVSLCLKKKCYENKLLMFRGFLFVEAPLRSPLTTWSTFSKGLWGRVILSFHQGSIWYSLAMQRAAKQAKSWKRGVRRCKDTLRQRQMAIQSPWNSLKQMSAWHLFKRGSCLQRNSLKQVSGLEVWNQMALALVQANFVLWTKLE